VRQRPELNFEFETLDSISIFEKKTKKRGKMTGDENNEFQTWKERSQKIQDLIKFAKSMGTYDCRFASFSDWPYPDTSSCSRHNLAAAGWFFYPKSR